MTANRFVLCNMAAHATRRLHQAGSDVRVEEDLKRFTQDSKEFLEKGTPEEVDAKNLRGRLAILHS